MAGFADLRRAYNDRLAAVRDVKAADGRIVGIVGAAAPGEVVLAGGAAPVWITPQLDRPTPTASHYIEEVVSPEVRDLFQVAVDGGFEDLDLLVITRPYDKLYYYLKEIYRLGRARRMPKLHMFDLMQSHRPAVEAYNRGRFAALGDAVGRATGRAPTEQALGEAVAVMNRTRALQRRLLALRWEGAVLGADALVAIGAAAFMPPAAYQAALESYLATLTPGSVGERTRLLVATSEPFTSTDLHRTLEDAGALVAAEDDWWGARAPGNDPDTRASAAEGVFRKVWLDTATSGVWPAADRDGWLQEQVKRPDVDAVIFYIPPSDHQFGWDYPRLNAAAEALGKPTLLRSISQ